MEEKKIPVEVWDRTCGYFRPVVCANKGQQDQIRDRKRYNPKEIANDCAEYL